MGSFADYLEDALLDHVFGCGTRDMTSPTNIYVGLSTTTITDAGGNITEPVGTWYARVETDENDWDTAAAGAVDNVAELDFGTSDEDEAEVVDFFLADALSGGNILAYGTLTIAKTITIGDPVRFQIGDLVVSLD